MCNFKSGHVLNKRNGWKLLEKPNKNQIKELRKRNKENENQRKLRKN